MSCPVVSRRVRRVRPVVAVVVLCPSVCPVVRPVVAVVVRPVVHPVVVVRPLSVRPVFRLITTCKTYINISIYLLYTMGAHL